VGVIIANSRKMYRAMRAIAIPALARLESCIQLRLCCEDY
jgi:hypothetical protein